MSESPYVMNFSKAFLARNANQTFITIAVMKNRRGVGSNVFQIDGTYPINYADKLAN